MKDIAGGKDKGTLIKEGGGLLKMGEAAPQLQILLNCAREEHLALVRESLRIKRLRKLVADETLVPEWGPEKEARLLKARKRHKALVRRVNSTELIPWPPELGGES